MPQLNFQKKIVELSLGMKAIISTTPSVAAPEPPGNASTPSIRPAPTKLVIMKLAS